MALFAARARRHSTTVTKSLSDKRVRRTSLELERLEDRSLFAVLASGYEPHFGIAVSLPSVNSTIAKPALFSGSSVAAAKGTLAAALVDDAYEQNDSFSTATNLGTLSATTTINQLVQADTYDWYRFNTVATGTSADNVRINFLNSQGDLDLVLYNSAGQQLRSSAGIGNSEQVSLSGLAAGTYYVRVNGYRGVTNPNYSLSVNLTKTAADDGYEENDSLSTAYNLGTLTAAKSVSNLALVDSQDWFRFTTSGTGTSADFVNIAFQNTQGNLGLELYNAAGTRLASSNGTANSERVSLAGLAAGTYNVRVFGNAGATNPSFSLTIDPPAVVAPPPPTTGNFDIQFVFSGLTASQQAIFDQAALKWESIIVGDLSNATYNGQTIDDLLINASAVSIDGVGRVLGQAGPDRFRSGSSLPYHGSMEFDTADLANMQANGTLLGVIEHEMGHVLGLGTLWQQKGLVAGAGTTSSRYVGPLAVAQYDAIFSTSATSIPLETGGGSGTRDAHWSESVFGNEIMTGYVGPGSNLPISRMTVGALADLGYSVNYAMADAYSRSGTSVAIVSAASSSASSFASLVATEGFVSEVVPVSNSTESSTGATTHDLSTNIAVADSVDKAPTGTRNTPNVGNRFEFSSGYARRRSHAAAADQVLAHDSEFWNLAAMA